MAKDLYKGKLVPIDFHEGLTNKTYEVLDKGAGDGYGINYKKSTVGPQLQKNLYRFSVAKTYQQLEEMQTFLVDEKGQLRSFKDFKEKVETTHETFNRTYLETEYNVAKRSGQAARQWHEYQADKDLFPNLEYWTVGDNQVRKEHKEIHGVIKPIDDVFWDTYYPPNGFRCRCKARQSTKAETGKVPDFKIDDAFKNNVGKTNQVFSEDGHPYFSMPKDVKKQYKVYLDGKEK